MTRNNVKLAALVLGTYLATSVSAAWGRVDGEAIPGSPFGVGRVSVEIPPGDATPTRSFSLSEEAGRAHYPAYQAGALIDKIGGFIDLGVGILSGDRPLGGGLLEKGGLLGKGGLLDGGDDTPPSAVTVYFLFTGDAPLKLTVFTPSPQKITVTPRAQPPRLADRLVKVWWRQYNANVRAQGEAGDYPPVVETYLTSMLAQRMALETPPLSRATQKKPSEPAQTIDLIMGTESLRAQAMRDTLARTRPAEPADQPVPADIDWIPPAPVDADDKTPVEPIALHVPQECFYVRFGTFSNHVWMNHFTDEFGGDLGQMVTLRGHQDDSDLKTQQQLALEDSVLGDLLGDTIIADVALVGRDTFTREGAAIGMLFQARNAILGQQFRRERADTLAAEKAKGATLETVKIGGHEVSFLSTPDNRIRSYYAVDGDFHFFSTSSAMIGRFFEAGEGKGALGASAEFKQARTLLPLSRNDTIFVYFSSAFFRGLVSPQYQIELARRIQSVTDMELLQLARLAARGEDVPGESVEDLVRAGLLPPGFGKRADGSTLAAKGDTFVDSLRGPRGAFVPIPDMPLKNVTREEAAKYAARATFYRQDWKQMDPLMISVKRFALDRKGAEKVVVDAYIAPFVEKKYGWLTSILGDPTTQQIAPVPGNLISVDAVLTGGLISTLIPPHHLFLGVQDSEPLSDAPSGGGLFKTLQLIQSAPGYLGAWPKPGYLNWLPLGLLADEPDSLGYTKFPLGLWRREWDAFSAFAFDRALLETASRELRPEETDKPAQVRFDVKDLSGTKLAGWVNNLYYDRAFKTSLGNTRLLGALSDQLHVPPEDALATAEKLLDVKLVCAMDGKYQTAKDKSDETYWESTNWPGPEAKRHGRPAEYQAKLLDWFRGANGRLTKESDKMVAHFELDIQRKTPETKIELPLFNLFGGKKEPGAKEPGAKEPAKDEPKKVAPKPAPASAEELPPPPKTPPKKAKEF